MASAPSRNEVEHLHRLMMQASVEAAQLDRRLQEEQRSDGLAAELRHWHDAADAIHGAVERVRAGLLRDGTPRDQVERVRERLLELKTRSRRFEVEADLDGCVQHWKALGIEFAQLSGKHRDSLVRLLESRKSRVDQTTSALSAARRTGGMLPEKHAKVRGLEESRDRARERYERLRQQYLVAERDFQAAEQKKAQQSASREHQEKKAPLPRLQTLGGAVRQGPVLVRLPDPKATGRTAPHGVPRTSTVKPGALGTIAPKGTGLHSLSPAPPRPALPKPPALPTSVRKLDAKKPGAEDKKTADRKDANKAQPGKQAAPHKPGTRANRPPALIRPGFKSPSLTQAQHAGPVAHKSAGPARISLERIERVAGYPTGMDGIGRGGQSAALYFRAENLPSSLSIQGTTSLQLGCAVRFDVMPSVQLFSAVAGAPLKGKLSLMLVSSGGRLGTVAPKSALEAAKTAARAGGRQVAGRLGVVGKQLESAIGDLLEDAADKIFRRAQAKAVQNRLPARPAGPAGKGPSAEHHVARFNHALGSIIEDARAVRGAPGQTQRLLRHLDRDHHQRDSVAGRLEQTLSHLATATHRTLTDSIAGELRSHLARMDSILARLRGKAGAELASGAQEVGDILQRMSGIAASKGGAPHIHEFRKLVDERRGQLHRLSTEARKRSGAEAMKHKGPLHQMPSAQVLGEKQLSMLRRQYPGIDKLIKNASHSQLASELGKLEKSALGALFGKGKMHGHRGGLGSGTLTGAFQALGGSHLGGFGGGHRAGALSSLSGAGGGLGKVLEKQLEHHVKRAGPHEVGKLLATFNKAGKGTPLHDLARKAEARQKAMATRHSGRRGPAPSQMTAAALLEVFKEHPGGKTFASHLAPGGALRSLCESAQRGHGLPVGQMAQHFLASRGHSHVFNAVATFNSLIKDGHKPHKWGLGSIGHFISSHVSGAASAVSRAVSSATSTVSNFASAVGNTVGSGISSFTNRAMNMGRAGVSRVGSVVQRGVGAARNVAGRFGHAVHRAGRFVGNTAGRMGHALGSAGHDMYDRASSTAHRAYDSSSSLGRRAWNAGSHALHHAGGFISSSARGLWDSYRGAVGGAWGVMRQGASLAWGGIKQGAHALGSVARSGFNAVRSGASWVQNKAGAAADWARHRAGAAIDWAKQKASGAAHWLGDRVHSGLEWARKTGVVGALGSGLKKGFSFIKKAAEYTPLGMAVKAGRWAAGGGLAKVWNQTKNLAGKAWAGLKTAYGATSRFLQSPAGQLLVTGLSLAANFIPGGLIVKAVIGGGIGAIQAISEGKDWKGVLAGAAGGALTGALPFLKIGPLAKIGIGALQGGITAIAQGGSLKDALKGAAGGALDSFDPGAFKALSRLKGVTAAEKLLKGKNLSKAEKEFMQASKFAGPLRGLEKAMANPRTARMVGGLERAGSKVVKGGIWVSGKAARAQGALDKVVGAGDKVHGVLSQVHDLAPGLADILGDNPAGHFVSNVGDWAGKGDDKLSKALEYGHAASDRLTKYRGYLDKGLGFAGVKNPARAYDRMMARKEAAAGRKGGMERVAQQKLADHKRKHPELHLAEATGKRTRGAHGDPKTTRRRAGGTGAEHEHALPRKPRGGDKPRTRLEQALARGRHLVKQGQQVAQGVHGGLGKVQGVVEKGLAGAQKMQGALEQASALAKAGAGILGDDSELGKYLLDMSNKADQAHGYLEQGIGFAEEFNKGVGKAHHLTGRIPGVQDGTPLHDAIHLDGTPRRQKPSPHDTRPHGGKTPGVPTPPHAGETEDAKSKRLQHAWDKIGYVSGAVQRFETNHARVQAKIQQMLVKGQGSAASLELMGLGSECDEISRAIQEAKMLSRGNDKYAKEIAFYEGWHRRTRAKLHAAIADTRGLGGQVAISGQGIHESTHPDIFENTRCIYAVRAKVTAFGDALEDSDAHEHVRKLLAEAKQAKADLGKLKSKYKGDKAASAFLSGGGEQDRLIDESIRKLEAALKGEAPGGTKPVHGKPQPGKKRPAGKDAIQSVEGGLKAIQSYRKRAIKAGRKVDSNLTKMEHALGKGLRAGRKIDSKLAQLAGVADQLSSALGEDSELGHLAGQVGSAAGKGHERLHDALGMAARGKKGLHKGHELFHKGLQIAAGHHEQKIEKVHGKKPAGAEHQHGGASHAELVRHATGHDRKHSPHDLVPQELQHLLSDGRQFYKDGRKSVHDVQHGVKDVGSLWGHLKSGDWKGALGDGKHLIKDGKQIFADGMHIVSDIKTLFGGGKTSPHDGPSPGHHRHHRHHHHGPVGPRPGPAPQAEQGGGEDGGFTEADIAQVVQGAMQWVTGFGKAVSAAIKDIEKLMSGQKTREAGDRVQAVSVTSEQTRFEVARAVSTSTKYPALQKQAQSASKHYLEIRKHFFDFVKGLHGLGGQTTELEGVDSKKYPDLLALSTDLSSLQVKVDALGQLKEADTPMQGAVNGLRQEASALRGRLTQAQAKHKGDAAAAPILEALSGKLQSMERQLGSHSDKKNIAAGDKDLGIPGGAQPGKRPRRHRRHKKRKHHDPIDDVLNGGGGGVHVHHRGGVRDDMDVHDGQDVDPAAADTWIGSGEGVKLFSEVFGAFIPAEGAVVVQPNGGGGQPQPHHGGGGFHIGGLHLGGGVHGHGGMHVGMDGLHLEGGLDLGVNIAGHRFGGRIGGKLDVSMKSIRSRLGKRIPKRATGFFKGLFDHLHGFADRISGWARLGGRLLGKGMHYAEMGMHGLSLIEKAAAKVQGIAGKAEGFLNKMGLGGLAGKIGGAAGWVGKESKLLHGGLRTADKWMGQGRKVAGQVGSGARKAGGIFEKAEHGRFGALLTLFKASKGGDGIDGKLEPEKMRLGSQFDEPRRLDIMTMSRMEGFLGGDFAGVRIHTGPGAAQVTNRFAAEAVTVKDHIFFAPGRFNPGTTEGQRLLAHELTHVMQKGRPNLDVRTAESEALNAEHTFGYGNPQMETLNLSQAAPNFRLGDGEGLGSASGVHTAKRNRSRGHEAGGKDTLPDGEEFLEQISNRVYDLLMEELEHAFESR